MNRHLLMFSDSMMSRQMGCCVTSARAEFDILEAECVISDVLDIEQEARGAARAARVCIS